jgi:hypothetical protein
MNVICGFITGIRDDSPPFMVLFPAVFPQKIDSGTGKDGSQGSQRDQLLLFHTISTLTNNLAIPMPLFFLLPKFGDMPGFICKTFNT